MHIQKVIIFDEEEREVLAQAERLLDELVDTVHDNKLDSITSKEGDEYTIGYIKGLADNLYFIRTGLTL